MIKHIFWAAVAFLMAGLALAAFGDAQAANVGEGMIVALTTAIGFAFVFGMFP